MVIRWGTGRSESAQRGGKISASQSFLGLDLPRSKRGEVQKRKKARVDADLFAKAADGAGGGVFPGWGARE